MIPTLDIVNYGKVLKMMGLKHRVADVNSEAGR